MARPGDEKDFFISFKMEMRGMQLSESGSAQYDGRLDRDNVQSGGELTRVRVETKRQPMNNCCHGLRLGK